MSTTPTGKAFPACLPPLNTARRAPYRTCQPQRHRFGRVDYATASYGQHQIDSFTLIFRRGLQRIAEKRIGLYPPLI